MALEKGITVCPGLSTQAEHRRIPCGLQPSSLHRTPASMRAARTDVPSQALARQEAQATAPGPGSASRGAEAKATATNGQ